MITEVPISHHLDLYRYWLGRKDGRAMPARRDIDPVDIPALLPYVSLIHKPDGEFRFRLVGSAVAQQLGRDPTGKVVGSHVSNATQSIAAAQAVFERVFRSARPVFCTGNFETNLGAVHNFSVLLLPLSDNGMEVNMIVVTRIICFNFDAATGLDWLKRARLKIGAVTDVSDAANLGKRCLDWKLGSG
jgi:hypothetical protein